jgi:sugar phosphate isomerase/epimerase
VSNAAGLKCSVITSSSGRELWDLFAEVRALAKPDVLFDLFILRDVDVWNIERTGNAPLFPRAQSGSPVEIGSLTSILSDDRNYERIAEWLLSQCRQAAIHVAALATYFPDVTSLYQERREIAVRALVNTVRLALELARHGHADTAVVELVCGTIADPCECSDCVPFGRVYVSDPHDKLELLAQSLLAVISEVNRVCQPGPGKFALAVELEPGETYVLNSPPRLDAFFRTVAQDPDLDQHVGLNLDIAHMRIVPAMPGELLPHLPRIVHAHIADHPRMHTRDQVVGAWTGVTRRDNGYSGYVKDLLLPRLAGSANTDLPFTGTIALELEGCNRIGWLLSSLTAMQQVIAMAENYP